ncbi:hypothetical protein FGLOB1_11331 [Fusarium globosum]|uniref:Uncharacterized protein n=1 Tax=Fusarium globosum TaxID=78864 RepID=A0A8H5XT02_9HYPO|nr:hypothetical protein FGLOB1_11331 [Fusarium globosum]
MSLDYDALHPQLLPVSQSPKSEDPAAPKTGTKIATASFTAELLKDQVNPTTMAGFSVLIVVKVQALHLLSAGLGPRTASGTSVTKLKNCSSPQEQEQRPLLQYQISTTKRLDPKLATACPSTPNA